MMVATARRRRHTWTFRRKMKLSSDANLTAECAEYAEREKRVKEKLPFCSAFSANSSGLSRRNGMKTEAGGLLKANEKQSDLSITIIQHPAH